jgi:hypothetical protein
MRPAVCGSAKLISVVGFIGHALWRNSFRRCSAFPPRRSAFRNRPFLEGTPAVLQPAGASWRSGGVKRGWSNHFVRLPSTTLTFSRERVYALSRVPSRARFVTLRQTFVRRCQEWQCQMMRQDTFTARILELWRTSRRQPESDRARRSRPLSVRCWRRSYQPIPCQCSRRYETCRTSRRKAVFGDLIAPTCTIR